MKKQTAKEIGVIAAGTAIGAAIHTALRLALVKRYTK